MTVSAGVESELQPLASMQRWWMNIYGELENPSRAHIIVPMMIPGPLDAQALIVSLQIVAGRHNILRARYIRSQSDEWAYVPDPHLEIQLEQLSCECHVGSADRPIQDIRAFIEKRFDVHRAPLFRVGIITDPHHGPAALMVVHHSIFDEYSSLILRAETLAAYHALRQEIPPKLPALTAQFSDFTRSETRRLDGQLANSHLEYWRRTLHGARAVSTWPSVLVKGHQANSVPKIRITSERTQILKRMGKGAGFSMFLILLSAFYLSIQRVAGARRHVVWVFHSGRRQLEMLNLIGCLFDEWPLRVDVDGVSPLDVLRAIRHAYIEALPHIGIPSEIMWELSGRSGEAELSPEIYFNYRPADEFEAQSSVSLEPGSANNALGNSHQGKPIESQHQMEKAIGALLGCHVTEHANGIECELEYDPEALPTPLIQRLLMQFDAEVSSIDAALRERLGRDEALKS